MKEYNHFTVNDFVDDASFRRYVLQKDATDVAFWREWLQDNPEKMASVAEAEKLVLLLASAPPPSVSDAEKSAEWIKLMEKIDAPDAVIELTKTPRTYWRYGVAASFILLFAALMWLYVAQKSPSNNPTLKQTPALPEGTVSVAPPPVEKDILTISTTYGQKRKIILPDGSKVMLNGNSVLTYDKNWSNTAERLVTLSGEAEFSVRRYTLPDGNAQKFWVKTTNPTVKNAPDTEGVKIEVIGTRFNLLSRGDKCRLALYEGKVKLKLPTQSENESILVAPNEVVKVEKGSIVRIETAKKIDTYAAWTHKSFAFDDVPLSEVAFQVESSYGVKFIFKDDALKNRRLTASIPDDDVVLLSKVIAQIFSLKTRQNGKDITFEE